MEPGSSSSSVSHLQRSTSQLSTTSARSGRGHTLRTRSRQRAKLTSHPSSSTSSIAASDKSLTSFPSFSPESPRDGGLFFETFETATQNKPSGSERKPSNPQSINSIVQSLTSIDTPKTPRNALFEDTPLSTRKIPGALHHADDDHIQRLVARHGASNLIRQVAEDLAQRDDQIANLRRRADQRERALRKIILECGLSNLDLEKRLREVETELKAQEQSKKGGLSDLMSDAMQDTVTYANNGISAATIRASSLSVSKDNDGKAPGTMRGWKDWILGTGTSKRGSRASSVNGDVTKAAVRASTTSGDRRPTLQEDLFTPPDAESVKSSSRASSIYSGQGPRKPSTSLASMALQLVAGRAAGWDGDSTRGRSNSAGQGGGSLRTASATSARTNASSRAVSSQVGPKALMAMRRATPAPINNTMRSRPQERWEAAGVSPPSPVASRPDNSGPVEMDTIFSPEGQPPILTHVYNNHAGSEFLTDSFGFIFDQRRRKRQKEAAQVALQMKRGSRTEMLTGKTTISPNLSEDDVRSLRETGSIERPDSPFSIDDITERPKRWQDYLKIATFPTELLSHTPSMTASALEVHGGQSPGLIMSEERGFLPPASTTAAVNDETAASETAKSAEETSAIAVGQEDTEPVKILLDQLNDVHEALQREKTLKWNEFMRKVRAERRREGEAAAAAAVAAAEARYQQAPLMLPEAKLADGELIGIADLGVKGKVGRNKWIEFRNLVLGGIPVELRPKVWLEGCGATFKRLPGYYDDLVSQGAEGLDPATVTDIDRDIDRTLRDNIFFLRGPGVQKLHELLVAYARRNPNVGYCQGMNLIAANLLLIMPSAEEAFWILTCMIEKMLPEGYFDHSLIASRADQQILRQYVSQVLPKLSQHLEAMSIDLETLTFQWFLSIFTDCLSAEALFRVWDVILCTGDGSTFLFQVALALLKLNERQLLACSAPSDIYTYINRQMTNHAISIDGLIQASEGLRKEVKREDVEARREVAIEAEKQLMKEREEFREARESNKAVSAPALVTPESASAVPSPIPSPNLTQDENNGAASTSVADLQELEADRELMVRTPMPVEEEIGLGLG
ncbi:putative Rab-GAP TBC domain-containing protein [Seiridium cardinale]|uniref:Rab-GAP TBC domain-containing protein n=1 Tax=Seiridium cardinale TaxID=138064 RepID=A0ABR2Y0C1_9PEZI